MEKSAGKKSGNQEFQKIKELVEQGKTASLIRDVEGVSYTRRFIPQDRLILLGGGHISQPLCKMASMLDFDVTVVDDRPAFANTIRFPEAEKVVCDDFAKAIQELKLRGTDYVCVITRGHRWDGDCLRQILSGTLPSYLGMIGSSRRVAGLLGVLKEEGYEEAALSVIHAPIGLKIGALTPAEIAVSICAQLVQHRRKQPQEDQTPILDQTNTDLAMLHYLAESEEPKAMLLVLSSDGSTPVKPGAMMAVNSLGKGYGTIGGGCSEAALMGRARKIIGSGTCFQAAGPSPLVIESLQKIFALAYAGAPASALIRSFSQRGRNRAVATTFFVKPVILVKLAITVVVSLSYSSLRKG
ncbi:MAG: XdhC/CoxI family protein [Otoolea sp.]